MQYIAAQEKPRQDKQGYSKKIFLNENDLNKPGTLVQQIKIKAGDCAESHYHKIQTEIFYFLTDNGYRIVNNQEIHPKIGDCLVIQPNDHHKVINPSTEEYLYMAFKFDYQENDLIRDKGI